MPEWCKVGNLVCVVDYMGIEEAGIIVDLAIIDVEEMPQEEYLLMMEYNEWLITIVASPLGFEQYFLDEIKPY
jgi:hypothetical protein